MSRIPVPLAAATLALLLFAGCNSESLQTQRLIAENRRLQQDVSGASALLTTSNIAVVIVAGGLAVCAWHLMRCRGSR